MWYIRLLLPVLVAICQSLYWRIVVSWFNQDTLLSFPVLAWINFYRGADLLVKLHLIRFRSLIVQTVQFGLSCSFWSLSSKWIKPWTRPIPETNSCTAFLSSGMLLKPLLFYSFSLKWRRIYFSEEKVSGMFLIWSLKFFFCIVK